MLCPHQVWWTSSTICAGGWMLTTLRQCLRTVLRVCSSSGTSGWMTTAWLRFPSDPYGTRVTCRPWRWPSTGSHTSLTMPLPTSPAWLFCEYFAILVPHTREIHKILLLTLINLPSLFALNTRQLNPSMRYTITNCSPRWLVKHSYECTCTWLSTHASKQWRGCAILERENGGKQNGPLCLAKSNSL